MSQALLEKVIALGAPLSRLPCAEISVQQREVSNATEARTWRQAVLQPVVRCDRGCGLGFCVGELGGSGRSRWRDFGIPCRRIADGSGGRLLRGTRRILACFWG